MAAKKKARDATLMSRLVAAGRLMKARSELQGADAIIDSIVKMLLNHRGLGRRIGKDSLNRIATVLFRDEDYVRTNVPKADRVLVPGDLGGKARLVYNACEDARLQPKIVYLPDVFGQKDTAQEHAIYLTRL
jgi:hypothetical protein